MNLRAIARRFRFGLSTLMLVILAVCLGLGWVVNSARIQKESVEAIQKAGGWIVSEHEYQDHQIVDNTPPGNPWLRRQIGPHYFDKITYIRFGRTNADLVMPHIGRLKSLKELDLNHSDVTDRGLTQIRGLDQLVELEIQDTKVTPGSFATLSDLKALQSVNFDAILCDDSGLEQLGRITNLVSLKLRGSPITDVGMAHIAGLKKLESVDVSYTKISDAGLAHWKGLDNLASVDLSYTPITDAGLRFLLPGKNLELVILDGTKVTAAGIASLAEVPRLKRSLIVHVQGAQIKVNEMEALRRQYPGLDL